MTVNVTWLPDNKTGSSVRVAVQYDFVPAVPAWSKDFDAWASDALARGDIDTLAAYRSKAPGMPYSHPTVEHYVPMFITLGAANHPEQPVTTTVDGFMMGLSKRSFQLD